MKAKIKKEKGMQGAELAFVVFCKMKNLKPQEVNQETVNEFINLIKEIEKENKENGKEN